MGKFRIYCIGQEESIEVCNKLSFKKFVEFLSKNEIYTDKTEILGNGQISNIMIVTKYITCVIEDEGINDYCGFSND